MQWNSQECSCFEGWWRCSWRVRSARERDLCQAQPPGISGRGQRISTWLRSYLKAYAWQPGAGQATMFGVWRGKIGPRFSAQTQGGLCWIEAGIMHSACLYGSNPDLCWAQVVPMLGQVGSMLSHVGLILGLCWVYVGPMLAYVSPMLAAYVGPFWDLYGGHIWTIYVETILRWQFFRPGPLLGA